MADKRKPINLQIVLCGRGGQGVLFLTRLLDETAIALGNSVISSETHGMAMRGGSVASHIRIGDYRSPLIRSGEADMILVLSEHELPLNMHLAKEPTAQIYINAPSRKQYMVDADSIAARLGSLVVANLVLLGYACAHPQFPLDYRVIRDVLARISPPGVLALNMKALAEGFAAFTLIKH